MITLGADLPPQKKTKLITLVLTWYFLIYFNQLKIETTNLFEDYKKSSLQLLLVAHGILADKN